MQMGHSIENLNLSLSEIRLTLRYCFHNRDEFWLQI